MKIVELRAKNIMRLSAVEIRPDGSLVVVGGNNAAGKTSVLNAIAFALGGKKLVPSKPLRQGQKRGHVKVDLGEFVVTRTFTAEGGGTLKVESAEGQPFTSPQKMLDELVGQLSFDPLEFSRMPPREQLATLKAVVGLDFAELDDERQDLYEQRREANRDVARETARLADMPSYPEAPNKLVSIEELSAQLAEANRAEQEVLQLRHDQDTCVKDKARLSAEIAEREKHIEQARRVIAELTSANETSAVAMGRLDQRINALSEQLASCDAEIADREEINQKLGAAQETNRQVEANRARREQAGRVDEAQRRSEQLTDDIEAIDETKRNMVEHAEFPIDGLGFGDIGIMYRGVPFDQASSAEQLRVSAAMGLALNPKLKILLIRDGSLLDRQNLELLAQMADEAEAQIWIERVGQDKRTTVVIEDGAVQEIAEQEPA